MGVGLVPARLSRRLGAFGFEWDVAGNRNMIGWHSVFKSHSAPRRGGDGAKQYTTHKERVGQDAELVSVGRTDAGDDLGIH